MKKLYYLIFGWCCLHTTNAQIINFTDANLKITLLAANSTNLIARNALGVTVAIDTNANAEIEVSEAAEIYDLYLTGSSISNIDGLEYFANLAKLNLYMNNLTALDVSVLPAIISLDCRDNNLVDLILTDSLEVLQCDNNELSTLDLSESTALVTLKCANNQLSELNISVLENLTELNCSYNQLTSIAIAGHQDLHYIICNNNMLTSLDFTGIEPDSQVAVYCQNNNISTLDLSIIGHYRDLSLNCSNNPNLTYLNIKNGSQYGFLPPPAPPSADIQFEGNPNLQYICADEIEIDFIQSKIDFYGYTNCNINTYCSFLPGEDYFIVAGNVTFDSENDGCGAADASIPIVKLSITDGTSTGAAYANPSGNFSIPVVAGTYTITPEIENPEFFNIPEPLDLAFPPLASPYNFNFCISPNGNHPNLEITILPLTAANPGFDASYKIIFKNKGNQLQSGNINFNYNDAIMDLVYADPAVSGQALNIITWDFINLQPFETREIVFALNINNQMEIPAVNVGDILTYSASITTSAADETPDDNSFAFGQVVVGSFDPNDKTCLEGNTVAPDMAGEYVHYMIRFENTGTANAQNIVVKDMIDISKFDMSTLIPLSGSHSFITRITETNKVEFIFENINLPFDEDNNDGYIAFKIKTLPTLVNGDTFSNTASIYFDYNFPIVTNTATTTIDVLATKDFEFSDYFTIYPNPVSDVLNIRSKRGIEITMISLYNMAGQLLLIVPNAKDIATVDVADLAAGSYFIKINSDKGASNVNFIKQ